MKPYPVLVLHGGAGGKLNATKLAAYRLSVQRILDKNYPLLVRGASSCEVIAKTVIELENDPLFNAGRGSKIQSDGKIRMSASMMDGDLRRFAGCVNVEGVKNPILLARALMKRKDRVLSGKGAQQFAREIGLEFASNYTAEQRREFLRRKQGKSGTVGALALDTKGRLAAATSTGGRGFEYPHRVSDSPTTAGNFANAFCAVSATGTGEEIVEFSVASTICALVENGISLDRAVEKVFSGARKAKAEFGMIALDRMGNFISTSTTHSIVWGVAAREGIKTL